MFTYFQEKLENFSGLSTIRKRKKLDYKQKHAATLQRKPGRREKKGDPQAGQRGRLFRGGHLCRCAFLRMPPILERRFAFAV